MLLLVSLSTTSYMCSEGGGMDFHLPFPFIFYIFLSFFPNIFLLVFLPNLQRHLLGLPPPSPAPNQSDHSISTLYDSLVPTMNNRFGFFQPISVFHGQRPLLACHPSPTSPLPSSTSLLQHSLFFPCA